MSLLVLALLLQTTWINAVQISAIKPDLVLLALVYTALSGGVVQGAIFGFCIGFLQDINQAPADLGLNALLNSLLGFAVGYGHGRIVTDSVKVQLALIFSAVLLHQFMYFLVSSGVPLSDVPYFWLRYSLGRTLYTTLFGALISMILRVRHHLFPV
jgi:rod shape-determining protein MreD